MTGAGSVPTGSCAPGPRRPPTSTNWGARPLRLAVFGPPDPPVQGVDDGDPGQGPIEHG